MPSPAEAAPSIVFAPDLGEPGSSLTLSEAESHYLVHVCRARRGDRASATDGRGSLATLRLASTGTPVVAEVESLDRAERTRRAWVWCGAPEGERSDWLVEKLAELGVEVWQPIQSDRGRWRPRAARGERWRRLAIAAMRQSRGRFLMEVRDPVELDTALGRVPSDAGLWVASRDGRRPGGTAAEHPLSVGAIGPAGGFTAAEESRLRDVGFEPICLADGRLRSETAALAWAVWWSVS